MLLNRTMMPPSTIPPGYRSASDEQLVAACLNGGEDAWSALIDRYKNLIYAVPRRGGASPEDAADVFQAVCLKLFSELPRIRNVGCLRSWLLTVATHQWYEVNRQRRRPFESLDDPATAIADVPAELPPDILEEIERDQLIRGAIAQLPDRCRGLVQLLFYEHPPRPYRDIARQLGLATGSIGFIRGRCLARLAQILRSVVKG